MLHVGMLAVFPSDADTDEKLLTDITRSFHALSVLAGARWRLAQPGAADPSLPFHLAAVDAMRSALERDGGAAL